MGKMVCNGVNYSDTGDQKNKWVSFDSQDQANPIEWTDMPLLKSGQIFSNFFKNLSIMAKNVRYLWKMLGTTDISAIGDGTVTGAINALNTGMMGYFDAKNVIKAYSYVPAGTSMNYTASEDCYIRLGITGYNGDGGKASIGEVSVAYVQSSGSTSVAMITVVPLKKGQTINIYSTKEFATSYTVYGMC